MLSSSPHLSGSEVSPWQDVFDSDHGFVRYFGDNKSIQDPALAPGNRALLEQLPLHRAASHEQRSRATPVFVFERRAVAGRVKGNLFFHGIAIVRKAERVTQFQNQIGYFTNYVFELTVLSLTEDNEEVDWAWITARRAGLPLAQTLAIAPRAWQAWVAGGEASLAKLTRNATRGSVVSKAEQLPAANSNASKCLADIYSFYTMGSKHRFELLASRVVRGIVTRSGTPFMEGWVTKASGDFGVDFVGRMDIGRGFASVKVVVLGQAKCEAPSSGTSAKDIARTVARLRRGWVGAYVTTSFFTERAQLEMADDDYPLITVNGKELAEEVLRIVQEGGFGSTHDFLTRLDMEYEQSVSDLRAESILDR